MVLHEPVLSYVLKAKNAILIMKGLPYGKPFAFLNNALSPAC